MEDMLTKTEIQLQVSEMAEGLVGSEIIKLAGEIKSLIEKGEQISNLTIGDFNPNIFPIPELLKKEIIRAYNDNHTNYPAANGIEELREAIAAYLKNRAGLNYQNNEILVAGGSRPLIYAVYQTVLDPGDKVLFPVPSWNNNHYSHLSRSQKITVETLSENNFMPTADDFLPYISEVSLIALCSPLNPTGTTFKKETLKDICSLIVNENIKRKLEGRKELYLLYDQIYWPLTYGHTLHHNPVKLVPEIFDYTINIDGMSKAFSATGVRIGWAMGNEKIINKMKSVIGHIGAWAPKAEQVAAANYIKNEKAVDEFLVNMKHEIESRLVAFYNGFENLKNEGFKVKAISPQAAMYLTVQFDLKGLQTADGKLIETTSDITNYLLKEAGLGIVPFSAFGASKESDWYRLSVGTVQKEDIENIVLRIKKALLKLSETG